MLATTDITITLFHFRKTISIELIELVGFITTILQFCNKDYDNYDIDHYHDPSNTIFH